MLRRLAVLVALTAPASARADATPLASVVVEVRVPASTPAQDTIWVSGDTESLGRWNGAGVPLARIAARLHRGAIAGSEGTRAEYKLTRGSWATVEKGPHGEELANRQLLIHAGDTVRVEVADWRDAFAPSTSTRKTTITGDVRRLESFPSRHVPPRDVLVWLPPGWAQDSLARWPTVYFLDGQNVFDAATSFIGIEWGVDEAMTQGIARGEIPPAIVVAIANTRDRMREYTRAADAAHGGGGSAAFARFLAQELKPEIDRRFHGDPRSSHTAIVGSSLGGLCALDVGLDHDTPFGLVGCISPSVWWADGAIVRRALAARGAPPRVWLDIGGEEGSPEAGGERPWVDGARRLRDALAARGWRQGRDLHYEEIDGARHDERAWSARVGRVLAFLLADSP